MTLTVSPFRRSRRSPVAGILAALFLLGGGAATPARAADDADQAVLVMAPTGGKTWVRMVRRAVREADLPYPTELFFGLGDTPAQYQRLQRQVRSLEGRGAHTIVAVPLLVNGYSEVARQWKYLLGVDVQPGFISQPFFPVKHVSTIRFMEPLNDSAMVVEILLDRAQEISTQPSQESVIIVSNGPRDSADNVRWNQIVAGIAGRVQSRGGFHSVEGLTLREDAPSAVRLQAIQGLRRRIEDIGRAGRRALVLSLSLSPGGMEHKIGLELRGLNYAFNTKVLLPDSRIAEWIRSQVP